MVINKAGGGSKERVKTEAEKKAEEKTFQD
jgi:hypothetical protein